MAYTVNGLPSDLLSSHVEGARRLKVEAVVLDPSETPESGLIQKTFTYNIDGTVDTITEKNLTTLIEIRKQFNWSSGQLLSIVPSIL